MTLFLTLVCGVLIIVLFAQASGTRRLVEEHHKTLRDLLGRIQALEGWQSLELLARSATAPAPAPATSPAPAAESDAALAARAAEWVAPVTPPKPTPAPAAPAPPPRA